MMVKWYDYVAAFFVADFIWLNIKITLFSNSIGQSALGGLGVFLFIRLWDHFYIPFRVKQENSK